MRARRSEGPRRTIPKPSLRTLTGNDDHDVVAVSLVLGFLRVGLEVAPDAENAKARAFRNVVKRLARVRVGGEIVRICEFAQRPRKRAVVDAVECEAETEAMEVELGLMLDVRE